MTDETGATGEDQQPAMGETAHPEGTFLSRFIWTITSPKKMFADVAAGTPWWQPWVWVSLINMVIAYVSVPLQIQLTRMNPNDLPADQLQQTIENMEKFGFLGVISTPVVVLLTTLIIAGISYVVLSVLAESSSFRQYVTLYMYSYIVISIGLLLSTLVARMRGIENIRSYEDAVVSFGPAMLLSPGQKILYPILSTFDLFYVWFYVLMAMGLMQVFRLSQRGAIIALLPLWLIFVLIALLASRLSPMAAW